MSKKTVKVNLTTDEMPKRWYNILPHLPPGYPPPLDPKTLKPLSPEPLLRLFAKECIMQAVSTQPEIDIPEEVLETYMTMGRPTPLQRAARLEKHLGTPAKSISREKTSILLEATNRILPYPRPTTA